MISIDKNDKNNYRDYPAEAIREVLLNSIVHRDYTYPASTIINLYQDRMEVISIGGLPFGLSLEDVMLGCSQATSSRLLRQMAEQGLIIQRGRGKNTRYCLSEDA